MHSDHAIKTLLVSLELAVTRRLYNAVSAFHVVAVGWMPVTCDDDEMHVNLTPYNIKPMSQSCSSLHLCDLSVQGLCSHYHDCCFPCLRLDALYTQQ